MNSYRMQPLVYPMIQRKSLKLKEGHNFFNNKTMIGISSFKIHAVFQSTKLQYS